MEIRIHHVGSTAVPGLAAKNIIDIDIEYFRPSDFESIVLRLQGIGYAYHGTQGIPDRHVLKREKGRNHSILDSIKHHLYACPKGSREINRHIQLRNFLRKNPHASAIYARLKRELAKEAGHDRRTYARLKESRARGLIQDFLNRAG